MVAIQTGDVASLQRLLGADPALARARVDGKRTLLHVATDWPGHFPNVRETIAVLAAHGADLNAKMLAGHHAETPLHWAASSDDLDALDALLDLGADIEAPGAVIGGGTPLADAVAFATWRAARRLIERGARTTIWQAASLGLMDRLASHLAADPPPDAHALTNAFWGACHGGQAEAARVLLSRGANLNWVGHGRLTPLDAAIRNGDTELADWLRAHGAVSAGRAAAT
ncbi:MAG: ankyrin repeat domain-containing protein [Bryobacteraceae bacterium]